MEKLNTNNILEKNKEIATRRIGILNKIDALSKELVELEKQNDALVNNKKLLSEGSPMSLESVANRIKKIELEKEALWEEDAKIENEIELYEIGLEGGRKPEEVSKEVLEEREVF